jgi:hypothetical protein
MLFLIHFATTRGLSPWVGWFGVRIFLWFNSRDVTLAEGLSRLEPDAKVFFSPVSLGSGLWLPKLADEIATSDAFSLLIGPKGLGPWQKVEYFTAFDRHVNEQTFALVPVLASGATAPGLPFTRQQALIFSIGNRLLLAYRCQDGCP